MSNEFFWKSITAVFAIALIISLSVNFIGGSEQVKYNRYCKSQGLDYANVDLVFAEFECCKTFKVSDPNLNQTTIEEGCLEPLGFEVVG